MRRCNLLKCYVFITLNKIFAFQIYVERTITAISGRKEVLEYQKYCANNYIKIFLLIKFIINEIEISTMVVKMF